MRCTNRIKKFQLLCISFVAAVFVAGCGKEEIVLNQEYDAYSYEDGILNEYSEENVTYFSEDLCVTDAINFGTEKTDSQVAQGAGAFNISTGEVLYSQNIFERLYPASTTKILTAYIIIRDCNLDSVVVVSEGAAIQEEEGSSVAGLNTGDNITVRDLLYGLMLRSGNDAAEALAEFHSGSLEAFAEVMNQTALEFGATGSHFVNPSGLPNKEHYTTIYDMYLIFEKALSLPEFKEIISTRSYTANYVSATGKSVVQTYTNGLQYFTGQFDTPKNFTIIGGKTGTTAAAKYCLVLYSQNADGEDIISIVFKADCRHNLYLLHNQMLRGFAK